MYTFLDEFINTSSSAEGWDVSREMIVGRALPGLAVDVERDPHGTAIFSTDQSVLDATDTEAGP